MLVLTPPKAMIWSLGILAIVVIPLSVAWFITSAMNTQYMNQLEELKVKVTNIDTQLAQYDTKEGPKFDPIAEIEKVLKNNRTKIMAYSALGDSIPQNIYLNYFMTGKTGYIDIQGCADTVEDVYLFFQNLKDSLVGSNLRLSKLDLKSESLDDLINGGGNPNTAPYVFEITNMNESQLKSFMSNLIPQDDKKLRKNRQNDDNAKTNTKTNDNEDSSKQNKQKRTLNKANNTQNDTSNQ